MISFRKKQSFFHLSCFVLAFIFSFLPCTVLAASPLALDLFAGEHFSFVVPAGWEVEGDQGMSIFHHKDSTIMLTVEEMDVSDYVPFDAEDLYAAMAAGLGGEGISIPLDGHTASLVELKSDSGCLCTVLYCRGVYLFAMSATSPDSDSEEIRSLLLNLIRYTAFLG